MGMAEVVGFAACWLVVAALMLWGVFTEKKRGPAAVRAADGAAGGLASQSVGPDRPRPTGWWSRSPRAPPRRWPTRPASWPRPGWPRAASTCRRFRPADIRTEVTTTGDGVSTTRVLVRAASLQASRRHH